MAASSTEHERENEQADESKTDSKTVQPVISKTVETVTVEENKKDKKDTTENNKTENNTTENNTKDPSSLVLDALASSPEISSDDLPADNLHGVLLSLETKGQVTFDLHPKQTRLLTEEGKKVLETGTGEYRLYKAIPPEGGDAEILKEYKTAAGEAFKRGWVIMTNGWVRRCHEPQRGAESPRGVTSSVGDAAGSPTNPISTTDVIPIPPSLEQFNSETVTHLKNLPNLTDSQFTALRRRKLVDQRRVNRYTIRRGPKFGETSGELSELTAEIIVRQGVSNLALSNLSFKAYNFETTGTLPPCGALHPLMKIREEIKRIFLEMGFNEMETGRYVESSFWNFDSLFQPQNHPSRDSHDTFFMRSPEKAVNFEEGYFKRVGEVHRKGGYGSTGHQGVWSPEEAERNVLRTHTTAVSARYLERLARAVSGGSHSGNREESSRSSRSSRGGTPSTAAERSESELSSSALSSSSLSSPAPPTTTTTTTSSLTPTKLFSIDKVFRNESVDATHLAEFHQVEGLIAGKDLGLGNLMGILKTFFMRLGIKQVKFKPAFNPYTEPSMEVFGFHEGLNRWIEIGNSGIFRPEMLRPMGFSEDVTVIAWGLSVERPAMIKYGLNNIRELVGHKVDLNFIKRSGFVYF